MSDEQHHQGNRPGQEGPNTPNAPDAAGSPDAAEPPTDGAAADGEDSEGKRKRTGLRRLVPTWRMVLGGVLLVLLLCTGTLVAGYLLVDVPEPKDHAVAQSNVYLYSDGTPIAKDGEVNRENVTLAQVPKRVQHAVLAAEDRDFYNQSAIDPKAMVRAAWNMVRGEGKQSGSTITQQYVKNFYLSQERTVTRKAQEFFIAIKLDREVSKDDILIGYLNTSYFGRNAYGIQSAAQAYYGKNAEDLTTAEGAYLAAVVNSPSAYDVSAQPQNRDKALARWNYTLDGMVKEGWLKSSERAGMKFPEPEDVKAAPGRSGQRGYLLEAVKQHLINSEVMDEQRLASGGFRITTTIDRKRQEAMVKAVDEKLMSRLDDEREVDKYVRAGGTSIDSTTGKVVAMYGGIDYTKQYVNNATRRDYQAASTFKPFVYAAALENDSTAYNGQPIGPQTVYDGTSKRQVTAGGQPTDWAPQNERDISYGQIPVTEAMDKSVNAVFAQMGVDVGPEQVKDTVTRLGIPKDTPELAKAQSSVSLGTATPSTLDVAQAYTTLSNHGKYRDYSMIEEISRGGERIKLPEPESRQAIERSAADSTTAMLRSVVEGGTGQAAQAAGRPAAGKTGTAEKDTAAWFAGYTPDLTTVISVMGQDPENGAHKSLYGAAGQERISGGGYPAQIWAQYTAAALEGSAVKDFELEAEEVPPPAPGDPNDPEQPGDGEQPPGQGDSGGDEGGQDNGGADGGADEGQDGGQDGGADEGQDGGGDPGGGGPGGPGGGDPGGPGGPGGPGDPGGGGPGDPGGGDPGGQEPPTGDPGGDPPFPG
ncbi:penicillin-binding protein [Streptomyces sp. XM4193]|uniref:transglycosylase domain-containing protein n=1 Tax=Streptomyces sp. XM4193 TaxID=2929782 RepID=UPI001FF95823|nr:transglycosylase domain-containing protein [Streptomyces sp. XM4193]MCK1798512.1 penicillin-binding protein [Streptomyces sp. XM4193]